MRGGGAEIRDKRPSADARGAAGLTGGHGEQLARFAEEVVESLTRD
jgi:hypothetical protein